MRFTALDPGLAFLLTLAALPMAGCDLDGHEPSDDATGDTTIGGEQTDATTSSSDTGASTSTGSDPTEDPTTTDSADTTGAVETTTSGDPTTGGGGQICEAYAAHIVLCFPQQGPNQAMFVEYCTSSLDYYGSVSADCLAAAEDLYACLVAVDCEVFLDDGNCPEQTAALEGCG